MNEVIFDELMPTDLEAITAYVEPEVKQRLQEWAKSERRSLSSLAAYLLTQACENHQKQKEDS
jgi:predicted transcriptional regulator